jgi:hypothetical protein
MRRSLTYLVQVAAIAVVALCGPTIAHAQRVQWKVADGGSGHWYEAVGGTFTTWSEANIDAQTRGGYLATITSSAEDQFVYNIIKDPSYWNVFWDGGICKDNDGPWIGGFKPSSSPGNWQWVTGEAWSYTISWSRFSDRKAPLNKVETDLLNQGIFTLSA